MGGPVRANQVGATKQTREAQEARFKGYSVEVGISKGGPTASSVPEIHIRRNRSLWQMFCDWKSGANKESRKVDAFVDYIKTGAAFDVKGHSAGKSASSVDARFSVLQQILGNSKASAEQKKEATSAFFGHVKGLGNAVNIQDVRRMFGEVCSSFGAGEAKEAACKEMLDILKARGGELNAANLRDIKSSLGSAGRGAQAKALRLAVDDLLQAAELRENCEVIGRQGASMGERIGAFETVLTSSRATPEQKEKACKDLLEALNVSSKTVSVEELSIIAKALSSGISEIKEGSQAEALQSKVESLRIDHSIASIKKAADFVANIAVYEHVLDSPHATFEQKDLACQRMAEVLTSMKAEDVSADALGRISRKSINATNLRSPKNASKANGVRALDEATASIEIDHNIHVLTSGKNKSGNDASVKERTDALRFVLQTSLGGGASTEQKTRALIAAEGFLKGSEAGDMTPEELSALDAVISSARWDASFGEKKDEQVLQACKTAEAQVKDTAKRFADSYQRKADDIFNPLIKQNAEAVAQRGFDNYISLLGDARNAQGTSDGFRGVSLEGSSGNGRLEYTYLAAKTLQTSVLKGSYGEKCGASGPKEDGAPDWVDFEREALNIYHARASSGGVDWANADFREDPALLADSNGICERAFKIAQAKSNAAGG